MSEPRDRGTSGGGGLPPVLRDALRRGDAQVRPLRSPESRARVLVAVAVAAAGAGIALR